MESSDLWVRFKGLPVLLLSRDVTKNLTALSIKARFTAKRSEVSGDDGSDSVDEQRRAQILSQQLQLP